MILTSNLFSTADIKWESAIERVKFCNIWNLNIEKRTSEDRRSQLHQGKYRKPINLNFSPTPAITVDNVKGNYNNSRKTQATYEPKSR